MSPPLRELRSRSVSQPLQQQHPQIMGNNQSMVGSPGSPQLAKPLPQEALETMMKIEKLPSLNEIIHGEEEERPIENATEVIPIKPVVDMKDFVQVEGDGKLDLMMMAINKINTSFHYKLDRFTSVLTDEEDGVFPRMRDCERDLDEFRDRINVLEEENEQLKSDMHILKGVVKVQQNRMEVMNEKLIDLKARSMASNIIIDGIVESNEENEGNCQTQVMSFLQQQLEMDVESNEVVKAHRLGEKAFGRPRPIVVQCQNSLRKRVFGYTKNLKDKFNPNNKKYFVDPQQPEEWSAERKEINSAIYRAKEKVAGTNQTVNFAVKKRQLYINNQLQKKQVASPKVENLLALTMEERKRILERDMTDETLMTEKGNQFIGRAARVNSLEEVRGAYAKMKLLYPDAEHIVMAFKWAGSEGCCDDGENFVGDKILKQLLSTTIGNMDNVAVFGARKFTTRIGPRRFLLYQKIVDNSLKLLNAPRQQNLENP